MKLLAPSPWGHPRRHGKTDAAIRDARRRQHKRQMILAIAALVALLVAGLSWRFTTRGGGATAHSVSNLTIQIENAWGVTTYALTCDPPGGDVPDPTALCDRIAHDADAILFTPPNNSTCIGGLNTAHIRVTGTWQGKDVATEETDACQGNTVAEAAWLSQLKASNGPP